MAIDSGLQECARPLDIVHHVCYNTITKFNNAALRVSSGQDENL
jgi:hypothetical protein